ncbi:hypothetical protein MWU60_11510 [Yoonia sp. F2084L]|uniref:hypothetical protein n=1 Tax=Yoonia sp. F2084L TaxID=2926419 RepID=UPI001FF23631|nr:hypothetical protein [Yoonia sp. F2084L]MCK0096200.1 hypothetical protein [Yoonia sp. F2084L]
MFGDCTETVSILQAIVFGADGACVMLSTGSILTAFAAFIVLVVIAQFLARRLWAKLMQNSVSVENDLIDPTGDHPFHDDPNYRNSAIRSTKR